MQILLPDGQAAAIANASQPVLEMPMPFKSFLYESYWCQPLRAARAALHVPSPSRPLGTCANRVLLGPCLQHCIVLYCMHNMHHHVPLSRAACFHYPEFPCEASHSSPKHNVVYSTCPIASYPVSPAPSRIAPSPPNRSLQSSPPFQRAYHQRACYSHPP